MTTDQMIAMLKVLAGKYGPRTEEWAVLLQAAQRLDELDREPDEYGHEDRYLDDTY